MRRPRDRAGKIAASVVASAPDGAFERGRLSADWPRARAQVRDRGLLARRGRAGRAGRGREADQARQLALHAERRDRPDPVQRLLPVRPRAGHDRAGGRGAEPLRARVRPGRPGHLLRDGAWSPGERRRRHGDGDDQVVRHQLPLHRAGARPRHELLAVVHEALRRARRGDGGAGNRHRARDRRTGVVPVARQVRRRGVRGLRPAQPARAPARGLRRGDRAPRGAGRDLGAARRAVLRRGPLRARARCSAARL